MEEEKVYAERPNKTAIKREMQVLRDLGKQLIVASEKCLQALPISDRLRQEVIKARQFRKGALRRQLIFLEKLLRLENAVEIRTQLDAYNQPRQQETERFHELEKWRDELLAGNDNLLEQLVEQYAALDRQKLRQLIRNAHKEASLNKPPKSSRALFRYLRDLG